MYGNRVRCCQHADKAAVVGSAMAAVHHAPQLLHTLIKVVHVNLETAILEHQALEAGQDPQRAQAGRRHNIVA